MNTMTSFQYWVRSLCFMALAQVPTSSSADTKSAAVEKQITSAAHGHILTNIGVWSPDGQWIVYDIRSDPAGGQFDGTRIERVNVATGEVQSLYESHNGAHCGVVTYSGNEDNVVFILGPEASSQHWPYAAYHRRGVVVSTQKPGVASTLDARDLIAPFTPGALRGGTHVHTYSGDGQWIAFTYEDHVLATTSGTSVDRDSNQRNVGVSVPVGEVQVPPAHERNHSGSHFSVLVTRTHNQPQPGSDEISKAFSDAWVGQRGYTKANGQHQRRATAFQAHVVTRAGETISEVFVVDIPEDITQAGPTGPLQGTANQRPQPPLGTIQRRLTFTADRKYPGIQGVRHWLRSAPDGSQIAFLMKDDVGIAQLWTVSPNGGSPQQLTHNRHDVSSAFSWAPDGSFIAHTMNEAVCITNVASGETTRLTDAGNNASLRPEACVISPDGKRIAYVRSVPTESGATWNQIFVLEIPTIEQGR